MPFRFRKSFGNKFFRVNLSKGGISTSVGVPGARVTSGKRGVNATVGIPGSGISYTQKLSGSASSRTRQGAGRPTATDERLQLSARATVHTETGQEEMQITAPMSEELQAMRAKLAGYAQSTFRYLMLTLGGLGGIVLFSISSNPNLFCISTFLIFMIIGAVGWYLSKGNYEDLKPAVDAKVSEETAAAEADLAESLKELERKKAEDERREQLTKQVSIKIDQMNVDQLAKQFLSSMMRMPEKNYQLHLMGGDLAAGLISDGQHTTVWFFVHSFDTVGIDVIRKMNGVVARSKASSAILVTNSTLTRSAKAELEGKENVEIFERDKLVGAIVEKVMSNQG